MIINTHTKYIASGDTVKYIFSYFVLLFRIMIKYLYEFAASRNCGQSSPSLDFGFELEIPSPRKVRIITQRDEFGRIVHSKPPILI